MVTKGKNCTILGGSIIGGTKQNEINKYSKGIIIKNLIKTFRGATCKDMLSYVQLTLDRAKSDGIIIHVGAYDVSAKRKKPDIVDSIILVGKNCQGTVKRNVIMSSLVRRKSPRGKNK